MNQDELKGFMKDLKTLACSESAMWVKGWDAMWVGGWDNDDEKKYQQILSLIRGKAVTEGRVEEWLEENWNEEWCDPESFSEIQDWLIKFGKKLGVEVKK